MPSSIKVGKARIVPVIELERWLYLNGRGLMRTGQLDPLALVRNAPATAPQD